MKLDKATSIGYFYIHFATEVLCFTVLLGVFKPGAYWWVLACLFDTLAFGLQAPIGAFCEKHIRFKPGVLGCILLAAGALIAFLSNGIAPVQFLALIVITVGNAFTHIAGALSTLRVSEGRLSESAIFVGGGSFGVVTGKLISTNKSLWWIVFVAIAVALIVALLVDKRIKKLKGEEAFSFDKEPCKQKIATKSLAITIAVLLLVVCVRAYIGYGLPTAWNQTVVQTIFLFAFMGTGKMLGGILSDLWGARRVGVISCLVAVPMLLLSNNIMWLSLIGVACFSMTMAITLGGLVSVFPKHPGVAFGITTIGLLLGTTPLFFLRMPSRQICDILIVVLSILAAAGLWYCINNKKPGEEI